MYNASNACIENDAGICGINYFSATEFLLYRGSATGGNAGNASSKMCVACSA